MTESPFGDTSFAVPVFSPGDDPIACLNKAMAFLTAVSSSRFPSTNNQLRTSSNPINQATIQDGRVTVQQVQGRQGQNYSATIYKGNATSSRGNTTSQCHQPKRPRNAAWYKEKAMLAEAQKARQILDEVQLAFLVDPGIPADQVQTIIPHNAAFQTEDLNTYDSDCDDLSTTQVNILAEYMILSGADNRPPMLDKDLYDSWKSRMELYMQNREHGRMILESVEHGPLIWPTVEDNGVIKTKKYAELSAVEKIQADCDMKVTNIILQGLPADIYSHVNHHRVAKDLWERVQLLMQCTSLTKQEREYQFQVNTKFLNNLPPEWSKFMTDVKLVKDLHTSNFDQLHAYLEQHELHANEVRFAVLVFSPRDDPIAYLNKAMAFLTIVASSRFPSTNNQL
ncbi:hypothetical protein Tco_0751224 [Tanacetum coccineum]|uniref:Integrase, catalytic region, zinc finger, CCHC-type, peptidase aspartic, catalytic n=1 Tax=Tanacetum coccineum TaxID=301880 RepID=A0ABQ4Z728_9ASTR